MFDAAKYTRGLFGMYGGKLTRVTLEGRRIESWLGGYMAFRHTGEGKNVFISVDNRSVTFNPLHNAWKAKSFTDKDIVLHFCILDILSDGTALGVTEISDRVAAYFPHRYSV